MSRKAENARSCKDRSLKMLKLAFVNFWRELMRKYVYLIVLALVFVQNLGADEYQIVRKETFDAAGKTISQVWQEWDYFNKTNRLVMVAEGSTDGREYSYKYEVNKLWSKPSTKTAYIVKDADSANVSTTTPYYKTVYQYDSYDKLLTEVTQYKNGDKVFINYTFDGNGRLIKKLENLTTGPEKKKTTVAYTYEYPGASYYCSAVTTADGSYTEKYTYNSSNAILEKEIYDAANLVSYQTYQYNNWGALVGITKFKSDNSVDTKEVYMIGLFKPYAEVQKNIDNWLITYQNDIPSLEVVLSKYYFYVNRNSQYNMQLWQAYTMIGNMYYGKENFKTAVVYYKKALSYAPLNIAGTERIDLLRKYFYFDWKIKSSPKKSEYYTAYNCACALALSGDFENALLWLDFAIQIGFNEAETLKNDGDFNILRMAYEDEYLSILARKWNP